ncbi:MAG TPA: hypothetical protein PKA63_11135 [Oligoflexia bacterium]|nr:hypothetical protein [Oligoflexia bacterium]HMP49212.1 hypothetical protein [Oligoflexia bacterium]
MFTSSLFYSVIFGFSLSVSNQQTEKVDLIEFNHCHDEMGRHCYDQVIFYEWSPDYKRYHVIGWRLVCSDENLPRRKSTNYEVTWFNRESKSFCRVISPVLIESWTCFDPERENKKLFDEKYRRKLFPEKCANSK